MVDRDYEMGLAMIDDHQPPKTLRIALIDADPVDRVVTQHILTRRGHQVTAFEHADGAEERLGLEPVDVMVISGDGMGLPTVPQRQSAGGGVPIVVITNENIDHQDFMGLAVILPRPVGSRELLAAVAMAGRKGPAVIVHR